MLLRLLAAPTIASKRSIWRQYDQQVGINTLVLPGSDAAVLRIKGTPRAVAVATDGNGRYGQLDPFLGGAMAVAEAARNVVCAGGRPLAVTNCLNFGSPERPEIMWQFAEAVDGIAAACEALGIPVTGGNVSFYNETLGRAILPTPVIGVVGLLEDAERRTTQWFKEDGGRRRPPGRAGRAASGGSEYLQTVHGRLGGVPAPLDLERERAVQAACLAAIEAGCRPVRSRLRRGRPRRGARGVLRHRSAGPRGGGGASRGWPRGRGALRRGAVAHRRLGGAGRRGAPDADRAGVGRAR